MAVAGDEVVPEAAPVENGARGVLDVEVPGVPTEAVSPDSLETLEGSR